MVQQVGPTGSPERPQGNAAGEVKPNDKPVQIFSGMRIADIEANGSEAQKIAAKAFDGAHLGGKNDKVYDEKEAKYFNDYKFTYSPESKEFRAQYGDCSVVIKYENEEQLNENIKLICEAMRHDTGKIVYDLGNKKATFENVASKYLGLGGLHKPICQNIVIKNSSFNTIDARHFSGNLKLENVKDVGMVWDSTTKVAVTKGKEPTIQADSSSDIEIVRK